MRVQTWVGLLVFWKRDWEGEELTSSTWAWVVVGWNSKRTMWRIGIVLLVEEVFGQDGRTVGDGLGVLLIVVASEVVSLRGLVRLRFVSFWSCNMLVESWFFPASATM